MFDANKDWTDYNLGALPSIRFDDGATSGRLVMRRRINGKWEYRRPTVGEEAEYMSLSAW